jgi:hypothetical protein
MSSFDIWIQSRANDDFLRATLLAKLVPSDLITVEREWNPVRSELMQRLLAANVDRRMWPQSLHWDWSLKSLELEKLESTGFGVVFEKKWQGVMMTQTASYFAKLKAHRDKPLVYIDYLEIAPWNWVIDEINHSGLFKTIGTQLFWRAILQSREEGFKGRIGLHSLSRAENFYRSFGMVEVGNDPAKQNLMYFELTEEVAEKLLIDRGNK